MPDLPGFAATTLKGGARYVALHYSADDEKNEAWARAYRQSNSIPQREWDQQMELMEDIYEGKPVYGEYRDSYHCPRGSEPLRIIQGSTLIAGWDCGATLFPAFNLVQIVPKYLQVHAILELTSDGGEPMEAFAPRVMTAIRQLLPGNWADVEHWADTTVTQRNGTNGETAQQVARRFGFELRPSSNVWEHRLDAVTWNLMRQLDNGHPGFVIDGARCPVLRKAMSGAYKIDVSGSSPDVSGPGTVYRERPLKNQFSHVADANQYALMKVKKLLMPKESKGVRDGLNPKKEEFSLVTALGRG
ncbi:MAG TPA: hypothetical protein VG944_08420 [Fimbriimonas sp.]|nr:hypothetical protein [Fimbriimonas sp.]